MENLDLRCAELGSKLAGLEAVDEKLLTDALAVLEEQGLYAYFLFLAARGKDGHRRVSATSAEFLRSTPQGAPLLLGDGDPLAAVRQLVTNLDSLLFARDLLGQALVYGRYHAKAKAVSVGADG